MDCCNFGEKYPLLVLDIRTHSGDVSFLEKLFPGEDSLNGQHQLCGIKQLQKVCKEKSGNGRVIVVCSSTEDNSGRPLSCLDYVFDCMGHTLAWHVVYVCNDMQTVMKQVEASVPSSRQLQEALQGGLVTFYGADSKNSFPSIGGTPVGEKTSLVAAAGGGNLPARQFQSSSFCALDTFVPCVAAPNPSRHRRKVLALYLLLVFIATVVLIVLVTLAVREDLAVDLDKDSNTPASNETSK